MMKVWIIFDMKQRGFAMRVLDSKELADTVTREIARSASLDCLVTIDDQGYVFCDGVARDMKVVEMRVG